MLISDVLYGFVTFDFIVMIFPAFVNIAKSEQSSHTPSGSHQVIPLSLEREKNGQVKGLISNMWKNFIYTVQLVISVVCTKFQNSRSGSS